MSRPRAACPYCERDTALTSQGRIWAHRRLTRSGQISVALCPGTGTKPAATR